MINRQQTPQSKRDEEFQANVQAVRNNPDAVNNVSPEILEAVKNQAAFSERRKKYGL
jgi:hypothetical protein